MGLDNLDRKPPLLENTIPNLKIQV